MKILTITLHSSENYGSSLQAFALQHFLLGLGHESQIINYRPAYVDNEGNALRSALRKLVYFGPSRRKRRAFDAFERDFLRRTPQRYRTYAALAEHPPRGDVFIAGSDQIWNGSYACGRDPAYFLHFVTQGEKLAYAASLGKHPVPQNEADWIEGNIRDFRLVTVREQSSLALLRGRGIDAQLVCDPVLLVDAEDYRDMMTPSERQRYAVVYLAQKSPLLDALLSALETRLHLKILRINGFLKKHNADEALNDFGPCEFLGLLDGADFIVASSFHATVFAHLFKKNFAVIPPRTHHARLDQFLAISGLKERIVTSPREIERVLKPVDWSQASPRLERFISRSKKILRSTLEALEQTPGDAR